MGVNGPGLLFLVPFVDRAVVVDLRERVKKIEGETLTTRDEKRVVVDMVWSYKVVDAARSVLEVENLESAMREMVVTELRAVVGGLARGEVMTAREQARDEMHRRLGEIVEAWGVEMGQVEIGELRRG
jgi:regulator of protease activity HflC (stomatin/prohibitin superfamily)